MVILAVVLVVVLLVVLAAVVVVASESLLVAVRLVQVEVRVCRSPPVDVRYLFQLAMLLTITA